MRKRRIVMAFGLFIIILLVSKSSSLDDGTNCTVDSMRIDCSNEGGSHNPFCGLKMSKQCGTKTESIYAPRECHNTLGEDEDIEVCKVVKFLEDEGCGAIKPSRITSPEKRLVDLRLYYNKSGWGDEALVNLTLLSTAWKELKVQYTFIGSRFRDSCRWFVLNKPVNSTLMYECRALDRFADQYMNTRLTVESNNGEGASYLFRIPPGITIHPEKTCPSDWHVFFYIHEDAIQPSKPLPVTVQSSPFGQVMYKIALARCLVPEDEKCSEFNECDHIFETKNTTDEPWTTYLPPITTGGSYIVTVQDVSDWCPKPKGCRVSVSPRFVVHKSPVWIALLLTIFLVLMFLVCIVIMLYQRQEINREFFKALKNKQPTVLLVYHPESQAALNFVRTLAEFLKNTCCVTSLMVDEEMSVQNPTSWTKTEMNDANRVLFIIPKDSEAQSFTPIRNQWKVALNHCIGHEFITSQKHIKRLAKLVHPASGIVPCEITEVRSFELSHNPTALANWLHDGSFLDQIFLWLPHIRSSARKNISPTWTDVKLAAKKIDSPLITPNCTFSALQMSPPENGVEVELEPEVGKDSSHSESSDDDNEASSGLVFDPEIPDVNDRLCKPFQESNSSPENSSDDDDGIF